MSTLNDWIREYARQASADFDTWSALRTNGEAPQCHQMMFLQMACEKLCKAYLILAGTAPKALQTSHTFVANPLPIVIRQQTTLLRWPSRKAAWLLEYVRH